MVPQWKMIPRFKTWVYVLFVFPVLSVSVEGRCCERKNLVSIAEHSKVVCEIQLLFKYVTTKSLLFSRFGVIFVSDVIPQEDIFLLSENKAFAYSLFSLLVDH